MLPRGLHAVDTTWNGEVSCPISDENAHTLPKLREYYGSIFSAVCCAANIGLWSSIAIGLVLYRERSRTKARRTKVQPATFRGGGPIELFV